HRPQQAHAGGDGQGAADGPARGRGLRLPPRRPAVPHLRHRGTPGRAGRPELLLVPHLPADLSRPDPLVVPVFPATAASPRPRSGLFRATLASSRRNRGHRFRYDYNRDGSVASVPYPLRGRPTPARSVASRRTGGRGPSTPRATAPARSTTWPGRRSTTPTPPSCRAWRSSTTQTARSPPRGTTPTVAGR